MSNRTTEGIIMNGPLSKFELGVLVEQSQQALDHTRSQTGRRKGDPRQDYRNFVAVRVLVGNQPALRGVHGGLSLSTSVLEESTGIPVLVEANKAATVSRSVIGRIAKQSLNVLRERLCAGLRDGEDAVFDRP